MSNIARPALQPSRGPDAASWQSLLRVMIVLGLGVAAAVVFNALSVLVVVLALVVIVMAHEAGHFVAAKLSGMKVTEYFLGFGPRLWSFKHGETEYGIKAIPAGGYVRIVGMTMLEEVAPNDEVRSYRQASFPRRIFVAIAGSGVQFLLALGLLWGIFAFSGVPQPTTAQITGFTAFSNASSPAQVAGFRVRDVFVAIDGHRFGQAEQFVNFIRDHPGQQLTVVVRRGTKDVTLHVRPLDGRNLVVGTGKTAQAVFPKSAPPTGVIGVEIEFLGSRQITVNPVSAVGHAVTTLGSLTKGAALGIGAIFSPHGLAQHARQVASAANTSSGGASSNAGNGPEALSIVGAIQIGAQAARQNISELLSILVEINIFIGMINLFPMLPLDGGHVAIAIYERVRTRRGRVYHADIAKLMPVAYVFLAFVIVFGLSTLYVNIVQPAILPGG